ncbi:hypothetical protein H5410_060817 [Solanum commersonii]|uniref:Uncharacterized protein n=1 Tax=Solanum commersonii TaxID=4109 RepID=A0A9J5W622_SOLCO|nr:hypothetical protein H5410_060817 [Solanum commersonii]
MDQRLIESFITSLYMNVGQNILPGSSISQICFPSLPPHTGTIELTIPSPFHFVASLDILFLVVIVENLCLSKKLRGSKPMFMPYAMLAITLREIAGYSLHPCLHYRWMFAQILLLDPNTTNRMFVGFK